MVLDSLLAFDVLIIWMFLWIKVYYVKYQDYEEDLMTFRLFTLAKSMLFVLSCVPLILNFTRISIRIMAILRMGFDLAIIGFCSFFFYSKILNEYYKDWINSSRSKGSLPLDLQPGFCFCMTAGLLLVNLVL